jgi:hypothetical protein
LAQFRILASRSTDDDKVADFDVVFLQGNLLVGDEFVVYETHHPVKCKIIEARAVGEWITLRCQITMRFGWENHWAGSIVDTQAAGRPAAFRYVHDEEGAQ